MVNRISKIGLLSILVFLTLTITTIGADSVLADGDPHRTMTIKIDVTEHEWWLVRWEDNSQVCNLRIEHDELPTPDEIYVQCGLKIYNTWAKSPPCAVAESNQNELCSGVYLFRVGMEKLQKEIVVDLPAPRAWIEIVDCESKNRSGFCADIPSIHVSAEEPLPNEIITQIQGRLNEIPFLCTGNSCEIKLRNTHDLGVLIEFWADSSYGDTSIHYKGRIRVSKIVDEENDDYAWQVDIISDQKDISNVEGCAKIWGSFPPLGSLPVWLENPYYPIFLESDQPYTYLAGQLISQGFVDASDCDDLGVSESGFATQCGLDRSRSAVQLWQNLFNVNIIRSAQKSGVPSQLIKHIFAIESQFWPATKKALYYEYGFGHVNELGADTVLLWNQDFYFQFCPLVLDINICNAGYSQLDKWNQILLRGALLSEMEVDVSVPRKDIDSEQIQASMDMVAETLLGNCSQVDRMIFNETDRRAGDISNYEDLWRFTLVNYHSGPGCLSEAMREVLKDGDKLNWVTVSAALESVCPEALNYVKSIEY